MNEHVVIVGTGFAGLGMAIRLKQAGIHDFTLLEQADGVGGVWRDNHYPGVACDVESHLYSFSFEPNPKWSRQFAPREEILAYLNHCADKYGIRPHIRFSTAVKRATFDEKTGVWSVETSAGDTIRARVVVSGSGHALSKPVMPDIKGLASFQGKTMHSARWDDAYPLEGKRVAVIGTGASAIQIVPSIAPKVAHLDLYQRTPAWILPKPDRAITPREQARFARAPWTQMLARSAIYWKREALALGFVVEPRILKLAEKLALRYLQRSVRDPVLREKLTPRYPMGCKRVLPTNDFYPALGRANVDVVTDGIAEVRAHSIVTRDGTEREVDAIVCATGFEAAEAAAPFEVRGRGGIDLNEAWTNGIEAYLGTAVNGFPNMFLIIGPNTGLGHSSMVFMIESQIAYIVDAIKTMRKKKLASIEVHADTQSKYNVRLQERLAHTVWAADCESWYKTKSGKNTTLWPGFTFEFRWRTRKFDAEAYECREARADRAQSWPAERVDATIAPN